MDSPLSRPLISSFVKKNGIDLSEYESVKYHSFNDCFTRRIRDGKRPLPEDPERLFAPCDALLSAYSIDKDTSFEVKGSTYTVSRLLQNEALAARYEGGACLVFRLCVHHYHRYLYIDNGVKGDNVHIKGRLHTVRPIALAARPVFTENAREYTIMDSEHHGALTQIEVGAMLVGKIKNHHGASAFSRGEEKGMFLYGGSTIILLIEKDHAHKISPCFFEATQKGEEREIRMGEPLDEYPSGQKD